MTNEPEGGDDVFWSLIERFADLALPDDAKTALETCPLCSKQLVAADFATHVEACVRALDEKDEAESLREAKRLAAREGPQDHTFKPVDCCPLGSACTSRSDTLATHWVRVPFFVFFFGKNRCVCAGAN